jgi:hypothetical protein
VSKAISGNGKMIALKGFLGLGPQVAAVKEHRWIL